MALPDANAHAVHHAAMERRRRNSAVLGSSK
jgi:hypothetical protein